MPSCWQLCPIVDNFTFMLTCILILIAVPLYWQLCSNVDSVSCWQQALMMTAMFSCWQMYPYIESCPLMLSCSLTLIIILSCWQLWPHDDRCILMLKAVPLCWYLYPHIDNHTFLFPAVLLFRQLCPYVDSSVLMLTIVPSYWQLYHNAELCSHVDSCAMMLIAVPSYWIMACLHVNSYGHLCWQLYLQVDSWCPHVDSCCDRNCCSLILASVLMSIFNILSCEMPIMFIISPCIHTELSHNANSCCL